MSWTFALARRINGILKRMFERAEWAGDFCFADLNFRAVVLNFRGSRWGGSRWAAIGAASNVE